jgi:hypothetical protein
VTIPKIEFGVEIQVCMDFFVLVGFYEKHKKVIVRDFVFFFFGFTNLKLVKKLLRKLKKISLLRSHSDLG